MQRSKKFTQQRAHFLEKTIMNQKVRFVREQTAAAAAAAASADFFMHKIFSTLMLR